jgi:hypothetical protein
MSLIIIPFAENDAYIFCYFWIMNCCSPVYTVKIIRKLMTGYMLIICILCLINPWQSIQAQPVFSHKHGFYDAPFNLVISPLTSGSSIYFTTDGSAPGLTHGALYSNPLYIDTLSIVRAVEIKDGKAGKTATSTYLFLDDIVHQPNNPAGYPSTWGPYTGISGTAIADYEMDPEMMMVPGFADSVKAGLLDLPIISLVTDKENLFSKTNDPVTGGIYIYTGPPLTNTTNGTGYGWERPVSFEYFDARDTASFQVDCALEIQGNHGRRAEKSPKHSFRLTFKTSYGPAKLNYPFFGADADSVYNTIILRAGFGNTWVHWSNSERSMAQYLRDRWTKDTHLEMGHFASHGFYTHLFINGLYWGIYNPSERLDKDFAVMYLGGQEEDYDVIKDYAEVADGNINAWNTMMSLANSGLSTTEAYQKIQGNHPDGNPNPNNEALLDVVNLADYMLLNFYGGNWDWDHHNWVAIRNRVDPYKGFRFFAWDGEHMIEGVDANILSENNNNCPSRVFQKLLQNVEFRRLFADRVQKHCFNGGGLTAASTAETWIWRANQIDKAVNAEAARWGDYRRDVHRWQTGPYELYDKESYWVPQMNYVMNSYFPNRTNSFLNSLRNAGLFPVIDGPSFLINGNSLTFNNITTNDKLSMTASQGDIYYTTDGSDPVVWKPVPEVSLKATRYTSQITMKESLHVKARCYSGGTWSATTEAYLIIPADFHNLKVTEIHYHPLDMGVDDNQKLEFIELKNTGSSTLDLKGLRFIDGIDFSFSEDVPLKPQEFIVLASSSRYFRDRYGFWPYATYDGQLNNAGERIVLITAENDTVCSFEYSDNYPWPESPDGDGNSLVPTEFNPVNNQDNSEFWRASHKIGGSPGADDKWLSEGKSSGLLTVFPNYPNPFNISTTISYKLSAYAHITITIINASGRPVLTLEDRNKVAGSYQVQWNGMSSEMNQVAAGMYFYRISAINQNGSSIVNFKMLKLR